MRSTSAVLLLAVAAPRTSAAAALDCNDVREPPTLRSRVTVAAGLGYSYPVGTAERGTDTRDVSFGIVPISLIGGYDLSRRWYGSVLLRYAPNVPTLCASGPDCVSSVGRDVWIAASIARRLPRWRRISPQFELELGWEWFSTRLSDSGVTSERSWNGPVASLGVFLNVKSQGPWMMGPTASIGAGLFSHSDLETPSGQSGGATAMTVHTWPMIGFRIGRHL